MELIVRRRTSVAWLSCQGKELDLKGGLDEEYLGVCSSGAYA